MRNLVIIVVLLFVITSSIAFAGDLGSTLTGLLKQTAVARASQALEDRLNRKENVQPILADHNLGRIVISQANGSGWYGDDLLSTWTENALKEVGFEVLSRQGREIVKREMSETRAKEFNPATAQPVGQLNGSQYFAVVACRQGSGPDRQIRISEGQVRIESDTRAEWAAVTLQIIDATGAVLASVDVEASDITTSLGVSAGWWNNVQYRGWQPSRRDKAVMAACIKAANSVGRQMANQRTGFRFDPATGQRLDSPTNPAGWRFDPYTGRPIGR